MIRWRAIAAVALPPIATFALTGQAAGVAPALRCTPSLKVVAAAQGTEEPSSASGVDASAPDDAWSVGASGHSALVEHWDGSSWTRMEPRNPGDYNRFFSVSALAPDDVWAVGSSDVGGVRHGLLEHWDGAGWRLFRNTVHVDFNGVDARTPSDVWAVGVGPTLAHFDGSAWSLFPSPPFEEAELHAVSAVAADDAWGVGAREAEGVGEIPLLLHWDGSVWGMVPNPPIAGQAELFGVAAISAGDVWAVGENDDGSGVVKTLVLHYDGAAWSQVPSPSPAIAENELHAVSGASPADVWAVGAQNDGDGEHPLAVHWDGTAWAEVAAQDADPADGVAPLDGVVALSETDVWAVGSHGADDLTTSPLFEHGAHVSVTDAGFVPSVCRVPVGTQVFWSFDQANTASHSATETNGRFDSGLRSPGSLFTHTVSAAQTLRIIDSATGNHSRVIARA
jgi:hypothetical protein